MLIVHEVVCAVGRSCCLPACTERHQTKALSIVSAAFHSFGGQGQARAVMLCSYCETLLLLVCSRIIIFMHNIMM